MSTFADDEVRRAKLKRLIHQKERDVHPVALACRKALDAADKLAEANPLKLEAGSAQQTAQERHAETMRELRSTLSGVRSKRTTTDVNPLMPGENQLTATISLTDVEGGKAAADQPAKTTIECKIHPMQKESFNEALRTMTRDTGVEQNPKDPKEAAAAQKKPKRRGRGGRRRYDSSDSDSDDEKKVYGVAQVVFNVTSGATEEAVQKIISTAVGNAKMAAKEASRYRDAPPMEMDAKYDRENRKIIMTTIIREEDCDPLREMIRDTAEEFLQSANHPVTNDLPSAYRHIFLKIESPTSVGNDYFGTTKGLLQVLRGARISFDGVMRHRIRRHAYEIIAQLVTEEDFEPEQGEELLPVFAGAAAVTGPRRSHIEATLQQPELLFIEFIRSYSAKFRKQLQRRPNFPTKDKQVAALATTAVEELIAGGLFNNFPGTALSGDHLKDLMNTLMVQLDEAEEDELNLLPLAFQAPDVIRDIESVNLVSQYTNLQLRLEGFDVFQHLPSSLATAKVSNRIAFLASRKDGDEKRTFKNREMIPDGLQHLSERDEEMNDELKEMMKSILVGGSTYFDFEPTRLVQNPQQRNSVIRVAVIGNPGCGRRTALREWGPAFERALANTQTAVAEPKKKEREPKKKPGRKPMKPSARRRRSMSGSSSSSCSSSVASEDSCSNDSQLMIDDESDYDDSCDDEPQVEKPRDAKAVSFRVINTQVGGKNVLVHTPLAVPRSTIGLHVIGADMVVVFEDSAKSEDEVKAEGRSFAEQINQFCVDEEGNGPLKLRPPVMVVVSMGKDGAPRPADSWYEAVVAKHDRYPSYHTVHFDISSKAGAKDILPLVEKVPARNKKLAPGMGALSPWDFVHQSVGDGKDEGMNTNDNNDDE